MIAQMLRGTEWSEISSYLSPDFFSVMPTLKMASRLKSLVADFASREGFQQSATTLQQTLDQAGLALDVNYGQLDAVTRLPTPPTDGPLVFWRGQLLLQLYFQQIMHTSVCLLDYRWARFASSVDGRRLVWSPSPLTFAWDPGFIAQVRKLYTGFYTHEDKLFDEALTFLGLDTAKQELITHFGSRQNRVTFNLSEFRSTFHSVFLAAKRGNRKIHPDFLPFGIGLTCLYEHLENLGGSFDPQSAFFAVMPFHAAH